VFIGAGDIATCPGNFDEQTAAIIDTIEGTVFVLGDNVYDSGTPDEYDDCYNGSWGRFKSRTRPVPGNHDYMTAFAAGYFDYFGSRAGDQDKGYYSFDLGGWHIIALNSNIGMSAGSAQVAWLKDDLAKSTKLCTLAMWHHPRFSSGRHGSWGSPAPLWDALYAAGAEIVLVAHDHLYERFAPQTPSAAADPQYGIRQFVVGTGGSSNYEVVSVAPNSEVRKSNNPGVLKLVLKADSYTWEFISVAGKTFTDSGEGTCHGANPNPLAAAATANVLTLTVHLHDCLHEELKPEVIAISSPPVESGSVPCD
jgi:acid phosphatase type 7